MDKVPECRGLNFEPDHLAANRPNRQSQDACRLQKPGPGSCRIDHETGRQGLSRDLNT
jgi:hypothetical protein